MSWILDEFLNVHRIITKCIGRFSLSSIEIEFKIFFGSETRIPFPPPPEDAFIITG